MFNASICLANTTRIVPKGTSNWPTWFVASAERIGRNMAA